MGAKVQIENYAHYSMRDLSRESNGASWPSCYGDGNLANGQFYYGFLHRTVADSHPGHDKDAMKQTMLEHEAIFKNQVYELHRLYRVQRDLMDEVKRKDEFEQHVPYETSSSSSPVPSHMQAEDVHRWNGMSPLGRSVHGRPLKSVTDTLQSSPQSDKGKSIQASPSPFQNCYSPKNSEVSDSRPSKCRRRMLDLQLPADEYIDTDDVEQFGEVKDLDNKCPSPDKNRNCASTDGKAFLGYPGKNKTQGDAVRPDYHSAKPRALADLNEPLHVEETTAISSVDFLGHTGSHTDVRYRDLSTKLLSSSTDPQNSKKGTMNGTLNNLHGNKTNSQDWLCYALESEHHKSSVRSISQGIHLEKASFPPQSLHALLDQTCKSTAFLTSSHIEGNPCNAKSGNNVETSDRSFPLSSYNISEPLLAPHVTDQPGFFHPINLGKSWGQSASNWGKPSSFTSQTPIPVQTSPYFSSANSSKSPQSSAQGNDLFGNKWNLNCSPGASGAFGSEMPVRNGFYQGSSAALKELSAHLSPASFSYMNCNYSEKTVRCLGNNYVKGNSSTEVNHMKEMNLNVPLSNGVSDDHVNKDYKTVDPLAVLPWLKAKGARNGEAESSRNGLNSLESALFRGHSMASSCDVDFKDKKPESSRKILGVPIFTSPPMVKKEISAIMNPPPLQPINEEIERCKRKRGFDINIPCEPIDSDLEVSIDETVVAERKQAEPATLRNHFDLNSCITEDESPYGTSLMDNSSSVKVGTGIDLEAPVTLEIEDAIFPYIQPMMEEPEKHQPEVQTDKSIEDGEAELLKSAAAAIVAISSCVNLKKPSTEGTTCPLLEAGMDDPLHWFVDIACSSGNDVEISMVEDDGLPEGLDDFEFMILRLKECDAEEYFPKPSIPEFPVVENSTCLFTTRTRKGQARRGRQKRDFQRDILPGLTTLSRHEVTEDLQTFGGLMRATGYSWQCGPNRRNASRNGCGRGRRRSVAAAPVLANTVCALPLKQQPQQQIQTNNTEVGLEDRSLTGWGKTTRRPRRQRYPAGNPAPPVPLT